MPKYEYACTQCGVESEIEQRMSDDPATTCPKCGEEALERLISRSSFALKGGGWYADGYGAASDSSTASSKPSSAGTESTATSTESSTEDATAPDTNPTESSTSADDSD